MLTLLLLIILSADVEKTLSQNQPQLQSAGRVQPSAGEGAGGAGGGAVVSSASSAALTNSLPSFLADFSGFRFGFGSRNLRVLVADSDQQHRRALYRLIGSRLGHMVTEAVDGMDAIRKIEKSAQDQTDFDAVFVAHSLPVTGGPAVIRAILATGFGKPIIGMLNRGEKEARALLTSGATMVIEKPFDSQEISSIIAGDVFQAPAKSFCLTLQTYKPENDFRTLFLTSIFSFP